MTKNDLKLLAKKSKKNNFMGIGFEIEKELHKAFKNACKANNENMTRVVKRLMEYYVANTINKLREDRPDEKR